MRLKKLVFLFDLDNCLLNTDEVKSSMEKAFHKKFDPKIKIDFWDAYESSRSKTGLVDVSRTIELLNAKTGGKNKVEITSVFNNVNFKKYVNPGVYETLKVLKDKGDVKIFSLGSEKYQGTKIKKSGLEKIVGKKNIIIVDNKKVGTKKVIESLSKTYDLVTIVDDRADVLQTAHALDKKVVTVWINQGKYKNIQPKSSSSITFKARNFKDASNFLVNFVGKIHVKKLDLQTSIVKGIDDAQIRELLKNSKNDVQVGKFTQDKKRFKNIQSFLKWRSKGKVIYSLINPTGNLLGIVWFSNKKLGKYKVTFAIRTYPPVRGLHLAKKIMDYTFKDSNLKNIWLEVSKSNFKAIKLYSEFGFEQIEDAKEDKILMVYKIN